MRLAELSAGYREAAGLLDIQISRLRRLRRGTADAQTRAVPANRLRKLSRPDGSAGSLRSCANTIMKGDSIVMHPILSKASLREPDTERLNTMLRVALTPLQYETVVAVYLHGHPQKEVAIDRGVSPASVCQLLQRAERRVGRYLGYL